MQLTMISATPLSVQIFVATLCVFLLHRVCTPSLLTTFISRFLQAVLSHYYPVKHSESSAQIPTCPYQWPNGQGDVAKFLQGDKNSDTWEKQYGSVYRIWSGMTPEIVLTRPDHVKAVFRDSDKHHKAVDNNSGYLMSQILGKCVGLVSGDQWRSIRGVVEKAFTKAASTSYVSTVERRVDGYFRDLHSQSKLDQGLLDPAGDLKLLPFLVIAEIIYGELSPEIDSRLRLLAPLREDLFKHVINGGLPRFSYSKYLPTRANRMLAEFRSRWIKFNRVAHRRAVSLGMDAPIVHMFEAVDNGTITDDELLQTLDEMLYANLDVTLGGISWKVVFLASSKDTQGRIRTEAHERYVEMQHLDHYYLDSTSYLTACILESARLRPLGAFSVPQSAPTTRVVGGFVVPAGTNFVIDSYALNIRNPYWGDDSKLYRPDRFFERKGTDFRYNYWRFGFGPRQCMGKYVADLIIRVLMVHLVENYELGLLETGQEWARDQETWINHPQMWIGCVAKASRPI